MILIKNYNNQKKPYKYNFDFENGSNHASNEDVAVLDKNHANFILVKKKQKFGAETYFRAKFEKHLAKSRK